MLHEFIDLHRDEIIRRCRTNVAARSSTVPPDAPIDHGVPLFLTQLEAALRLGLSSSSPITEGAVHHGNDLLRQGFTVSQVVHGYGDVCQVITELAVELSAPISAEDFRTLNRCLDDAIAGAVTEYGRAQNEAALEEQVVRGQERLGFLAHELRNLTHTALVSFEVLKTGDVGIAGSTGTILHRSLQALAGLISRTLEEVRLRRSVLDRKSFAVSGFIDELAQAAALMASAREIGLIVMPVEDSIAINADREILMGVVGNLLQNAFKFTRPGTTVTLRVNAGPERVLIEILDECGGIPEADLPRLFDPFEQRNADRTGLGIGLAFSRWGVEANDGRLSVRNTRGVGCVFTVDLPRVTHPVAVV
jgi:signal transduction histidine kinase